MTRDEINKNVKEAEQRLRTEANKAKKDRTKEAERQAKEQAKEEAEGARKLKEVQKTKRRKDEETRGTIQDAGSEIYRGDVQIVVSCTGDFRQERQFKERLGQLENLKIVWSGGSSDEPSITAVSVQKPMPLIRTLNEMPMVERVYKRGEKIVVVLKASSVT
jgi:hypothetical protein